MDRGRSGGPSLKGDIGGARHLRCDTRATAHIELENSWYHDDGLGPVSVFEEGEPERFCAIDEQAATTVLLVLNNPIAVAVLSNKEEGRSRRGRFLFVHDTFPSMWRCWLLTSSAAVLRVEVRDPDRSFQNDDSGGDYRQRTGRQNEMTEPLDHCHMRRR
jgi:hypothetical protein